ncbi:MAG: bis(5'-nucleosyl)-tetraphosphatase (symmetrical) YqeK [Firmicutes bacterium]|nr:bis(5'-nucleosyl)-tetraphosphatase (symmetrical) YqeK [Bacillota bacterium]
MASINMKDIEDILKEWLDDQKIKHSINVARTAQELAKRFSVDKESAYLAGLVHDIARDLEPHKLLQIARENNLLQHQIEEKIPVVLHANVGAFILSSELHITNGVILQAVQNHTVASPEMSQLDKIIYVADVIEPDRSFQGVDILRTLAKNDLDEAFLKALEGSITYLMNNRCIIHPFTIEARNNLIFKE